MCFCRICKKDLAGVGEKWRGGRKGFIVPTPAAFYFTDGIPRSLQDYKLRTSFASSISKEQKSCQLFLPLHNFNFLCRQPIKLIHQRIDLPIRGLDLALQRGLLVLDLCRGQLLVQDQHALDQFHHPVVAGFFNSDRSGMFIEKKRKTFSQLRRSGM